MIDFERVTVPVEGSRGTGRTRVFAGCRPVSHRRSPSDDPLSVRTAIRRKAMTRGVAPPHAARILGSRVAAGATPWHTFVVPAGAKKRHPVDTGGYR